MKQFAYATIRRLYLVNESEKEDGVCQSDFGGLSSIYI